MPENQTMDQISEINNNQNAGMTKEEKRHLFNSHRVGWLIDYMNGDLPTFHQMHISKDMSKMLTKNDQLRLGKLIQAGIAGKALLKAVDPSTKVQDTVEKASDELLEILAENGYVADELTDRQIRNLRRIVFDSDEARTFFAEKNLGLVTMQAGRQRRNKSLNYIDFEELVEEGSIGLMRAIDHFDPSFGCKFATPACFWIMQPIQEFIDQKTKTIRMPTHMNSLFKSIAYAAKALRNEYGEDTVITDERIAQWFRDNNKNITLEKIKQAQSLRKETISYDTPLGIDDSNSKTLADMIESDIDVEDEVVEEIGARRGFDNILSLVEDDRKRSILRDWYTSTDTKEAVILSNVSRKHCLTKERVKQLKTEAETELRGRLTSLGVAR